MTRLGETTDSVWVSVFHVTLSVGLALLFTPLFTSALGSLPRQLYSHGSAIVGTTQQLAGAIGTALFVAVMAARAQSLMADGLSTVSATAAGIHLAFYVGAFISLLAIPLAFLIRKPALVPGPPAASIGH
jgi:DHA2 family lincomycin resistance protein-like MFS transporter